MAWPLAKLILALMLFYHGRGRRDYHHQPTPLRRRLHWECVAILSGWAGPLFAQGLAADEFPALWIFPPGHLHGWGSRWPRGCRVCSLHLSGLPRLVSDAAEAAGHLSIPLDAQSRRRIGTLDRRIAGLCAQRSDASEIAAALARGEIGALALAHLPSGQRADDAQAQMLKQVLAWLEAHLHEGVGIYDGARACGLSPAHLRRIAHAVAGRSPRDVLTELRLERARDLLRQTTDSLATIAWACGYADDVALSKAFLRRHGMRPGRWRTTTP